MNYPIRKIRAIRRAKIITIVMTKIKEFRVAQESATIGHGSAESGSARQDWAVLGRIGQSRAGLGGVGQRRRGPRPRRRGLIVVVQPRYAFSRIVCV